MFEFDLLTALNEVTAQKSVRNEGARQSSLKDIVADLKAQMITCYVLV